MGGINGAGVETQWYVNAHVIRKPLSKGTIGLNAPKLLQLKPTNTHSCIKVTILEHTSCYVLVLWL